MGRYDHEESLVKRLCIGVGRVTENNRDAHVAATTKRMDYSRTAGEREGRVLPEPLLLAPG